MPRGAIPERNRGSFGAFRGGTGRAVDSVSNCSFKSEAMSFSRLCLSIAILAAPWRASAAGSSWQLAPSDDFFGARMRAS